MNGVRDKHRDRGTTELADQEQTFKGSTNHTRQDDGEGTTRTSEPRMVTRKAVRRWNDQQWA